MKKVVFIIGVLLAVLLPAQEVIWQEAESLENTGTWANDPQHVDIMGSPYLLATGLGEPVKDAYGTVKVSQAGTYTLWVRCRDWYPSHSPGQFAVSVDGKSSDISFGKAKNDEWQWINGGSFSLNKGEIELRIKDLTGWWGRVDALVLSAGNFKPSNDLEKLNEQRIKYNGVSTELKDMGKYDVVVVGGGSAGLGAAIAAARNGIKVAFIQDRPILGGNCSDEIMVPPMGYQENPVDDVNVTGIAEEIYPPQSYNRKGSSKVYEAIVRAEKNIDLFLNTRAVDVQMRNKQTIDSVIAIDVHSGQRMKFNAPLFIDTTGHGWIGYYAGAESRHGTESRKEFNESMAPLKANPFTMGNSTYKIEFKITPEPVEFKTPDWAYQWKSPKDFDSFSLYTKKAIRTEGYDLATKGRGTNVKGLGGAFTWFAELGGTSNTITDAEKIRDELFRLHIGIWGYQKNYSMVKMTKNRKMVWMNYVPGVRESRRLMGDYIMTQKDFDEQIVHPDTVAFTDWGIDDHHPHGFFTKGTFVIHVYKGRRVSIPYRSLYSKNINNLFIAGRCMSVTHVALGGVRVQRPMTATGQVVGTAAAIATRENCNPRSIYQNHISELQQQLLKDGCYLIGVKNKDTADLALSASTKHRSIIDGWNRKVKGVSSAVPWRAQPVSLTLNKKTSLSSIHLSLQNRFQSAVFDVECLVDNEWVKVASNPGKEKQRRYVFNFSPIETKKVRFVLKKSSGPVEINEVRIYQ